MTTEELIQAFPECEKIKREDIADLVTKVMGQERFYNVAVDTVYRRVNELWPYKGPYDKDSAEQSARMEYFHGDYMNGKKGLLTQWLDTLQQLFIDSHGPVHNFDDACQIAADEWARMTFGNHMQNNGDMSDNGAFAMMLGTMVKDKAKEKYGSAVVEKFRKAMKDYYKNDCIPEDNRHKDLKYPRIPACDYQPNEPLFDILVKAGVGEDDAMNMCPWKTAITIDRNDNSVCVHGYQTARYM